MKKITKQGKSRKLLDSIIEQLQKEEPLDLKFKDHSLSGNWGGYRECHITPDWLLIYKIIKDDRLQLLRISRTGFHSDLFG